MGEEESPKNKVKFLCSYGGKVLPRPSDGILKYVGGETRVICVPRDVTFSELMKKVSGIVDICEVVLKYQLVPEDLDALVAVRTQEDVKHMMEEHDHRHGTTGSPMLRAFLFPNQQSIPMMMMEQYYLLEHRYIDAINGIVRASPSPRGAYSACCSPKSNSPDAHITNTADSPFQNQNQNRIQKVHKVRSSPNLSNLTSSTTSSNINIQPHHVIAHHHHHPPHPHPHPHPNPHPITIDRGFNYHYSTANRHNKPSAYHEDYAAATANINCGTHVMIERVHSVPRSRSPKNTIWE